MDVAWRESRASKQPPRRACGFHPGWFPGPMPGAFASPPVFPWPSPLREADNAAHGLETSHRKLAQAAGARTPPSASARDPASRGELHGDGERVGERAIHPRCVEAQNPGARHIATPVGVLSYAQPAPRLAERVDRLTSGIAGPCGRSLKRSILACHQRRGAIQCGLLSVVGGSGQLSPSRSGRNPRRRDARHFASPPGRRKH